MKPIRFTQYMRPHGDTKTVTIDRPDEIANLANYVTDSGAVLEIEVLQTGQISITCEYGEETIAHELCSNGPGVPEAVDKLIKTAFKQFKRN